MMMVSRAISVSTRGAVAMPETPAALMEQLYDEHAAALWVFCLRLTGHDRSRAEDVVQETLLRDRKSVV